MITFKCTSRDAEVARELEGEILPERNLKEIRTSFKESACVQSASNDQNVQLMGSESASKNAGLMEKPEMQDKACCTEDTQVN